VGKIMTTLSTSGESRTLRRIGTLALMFFIVKGLLWLAAPFLFLFAF
jgi:hypothetical protein